MNDIDKITERIGRKFTTFGGGKASRIREQTYSGNNPIAAALKDEPFMFAAGVNVKEVVLEVVTAILDEFGNAEENF